MGSLGVALIIVIRIPAVIVMMISVANPRSSSDLAETIVSYTLGDA